MNRVIRWYSFISWSYSGQGETRLFPQEVVALQCRLDSAMSTAHPPQICSHAQQISSQLQTAQQLRLLTCLHLRQLSCHVSDALLRPFCRRWSTSYQKPQHQIVWQRTHLTILRRFSLHSTGEQVPPIKGILKLPIYVLSRMPFLLFNAWCLSNKGNL